MRRTLVAAVALTVVGVGVAAATQVPELVDGGPASMSITGRASAPVVEDVPQAVVPGVTPYALRLMHDDGWEARTRVPFPSL